MRLNGKEIKFKMLGKKKKKKDKSDQLKGVKKDLASEKDVNELFKSADAKSFCITTTSKVPEDEMRRILDVDGEVIGYVLDVSEEKDVNRRFCRASSRINTSPLLARFDRPPAAVRNTVPKRQAKDPIPSEPD